MLVQARKTTVSSSRSGAAQSSVCRTIAGAARRRQRRAKSCHAIYVPEFPHQKPQDQGSVYGYRGGGAEPHGNGAQTINLLNGHDVEADKVQAGEIETHVLLGLNPGLINASGYSWTADYVTVTGDLCADLLSNIASEQRAKVVYEYLYRQIEDKKVRETIDFLLNREEAHNQMFRDAFNEVQDSGSNQDFGTTKAAKMYFSLSNPGPNAFAGNEVSAPKFAK